MQLRTNLRTQQKQTAVIAAQMIQSLELLEFGLENLQTFLGEQAEKNPLIEIVGRTSGGDGSETDGDKDFEKRAGEPGGEALHGHEGVLHQRIPGTGDANAMRGSSGLGLRTGGGRNIVGENAYRLEDVIAESVSLTDHLKEQSGLTFDKPAERLIAGEIIGSLDQDGYLRRDLGDIADMLGTEVECVEAVLKKVQTFDPVGIAARNLSECLRLQCVERGKLNRAMEILLDNLPLLARYRIKQLARLCGVSVEAILQMAKQIRELDPRPGRRFDTAPMLPALPDVVVEIRADGSCAVELNSDLLPRVLVDQRYYADITAGTLGTQEKTFVTDCLRNASWLAKNVEQRAQTVLKVATEIVVQQRDFLLRGVEHLRPLNLKDVARVLGMHESTVCRAIANKYMMTSRGMFALKYFFSNSIAASDGGEDFSSETIRHLIRQMIVAESATDVLSDDAIVKALRNQGVDIARRTVARYREMLNIASSAGRRRQKQAEGIERSVQKDQLPSPRIPRQRQERGPVRARVEVVRPALRHRNEDAHAIAAR